MNYEMYIKERQHFKNTTQTQQINKRGTYIHTRKPEHLLDGRIFYPISTWPSSIREIPKHDTITDKNTFKLILFAYGNGTYPNVFKEYL